MNNLSTKVAFIITCFLLISYTHAKGKHSLTKKSSSWNPNLIDMGWGCKPQFVFLSPRDTASFYLEMIESEHCQNPQVKIAEIIDSAGFKLTEFPFVRGEKIVQADSTWSITQRKKFIVKATDSIKPGEYRIYFRIEGTAKNKEGVKCTIVNNGGSNYLPPSLKGKGYKWVTIFYGVDPRQKKN